MIDVFSPPGPLFALLGLFVVSSLIGMAQVAKLIKVYEAKHELKQGSAGFIRNIAGWSLIAIWLGLVWFAATVIGDWWVTQDLSGALGRAELRFWVLVEILATLAASD